MKSIFRVSDGGIFLLSAIFLIAYLSWLVSCHWVKGYSDPTHWIIMAEDLLYRGTVDKWSTVFAMYLVAPLVLLGSHYVYISNILWLACLVTATCTLVAMTCRRQGEPPLWAAGLLAAVSLVTFHGRFALELVNPLREPFSYSMLLLTLNFIMVHRATERAAWGVLSGITFGIALGAREPNFFILLPIVNLFIYFAWRAPDGGGWRLPLSFAAGLLPGLVPFFIHNHLYSGVWWLPSYMVRKVLALHPGISLPRLAQFGNAAIVAAVLLLALTALAIFRRTRGRTESPPVPASSRKRRLLLSAVIFTLSMIVLGVLSQKFGLVPGMKFSRFWTGLIKTWGYMFRKIGWVGLLLALFGIGYAHRKKYYSFLIVYGMSAVTFLWFWSHYRYVKPRYAFAVELFLYPLVAVGLWGILSLIARAARPDSPRPSLPRLATCFLALLAASKLGYAALSGTDTLKVWQLNDLKGQLEKTIEAPYAFFGGRNHYSELLATISGKPFTETFVSRYHQFYLQRSAVKERGIDRALEEAGESARALLAEKHLYSYVDRKSPLVLQWFDYVPVLDMSSLSPSLRVYGNDLDGQLHEIRPWEAREVEVALDVPEEDSYLLGLDVFRIGDDNDRHFYRASVDGQVLSEKAENGFHYYPLRPGPGGSGKALLRISSDAPLPREPAVEIVELNGPHNMTLGRNPLKWMNFISPELRGELFAKDHGAALCESGSVTIPHFADNSRDVFVRFYYREDPERIPSNEEPWLFLAGSEDHGSIRLDSGRRPSFVLNLGPGRNGYFPETLRLALAADTDGRLRQGGSPCYIIPEARVWTLPNRIDKTTFFPADVDYEPIFGDGFFPPERTGSGISRWSKPGAAIVLPGIGTAERAPSLVLRTNEFRPPAFRNPPEFLFNGHRVDLQVKSGPDNIVEYLLTGLNWADDGPNRLEFTAEPFNPKKVLVSRDGRDLGINVIGIEVAFN